MRRDETDETRQDKAKREVPFPFLPFPYPYTYCCVPFTTAPERQVVAG